LLDYLSMILMSFLWAGAFVVGKLSVGSVPPEVVAFLRFFVAGAILVVWMALREPGGLKLRRQDWLLVLGLGATGIAAYNLLFFRALSYAPASDEAMIIPTLNPLLTMFLAALWLHEPLTARKLSGAGISLAGQALIFWSLLSVAVHDPVRLKGDLICLASAVCWSAYSVLGRIASKRFSALGATTWATLSGVVMILPFALWMAPGSTGYTGGFWVDIIYLAAGATVGAFVLWGRGLQRLGASRAAVFINLVPVFTVAMAVLFLGERTTVWQVVGMVIVLGGVYLSGTRPKPRNVVTGESA
jgi:drug/metabolite transporter (DMT)-like permease